jgi:hypothetical protein
LALAIHGLPQTRALQMLLQGGWFVANKKVMLNA